MHPYTAQHLVNDHIATLRREADDNRLAAAANRTDTGSADGRSAGVRGLLGHVAILGRLVRSGGTTPAGAD